MVHNSRQDNQVKKKIKEIETGNFKAVCACELFFSSSEMTLMLRKNVHAIYSDFSRQ